VYFVSPERLDGNGVDGAPNLFVAGPESSPRFVATLESGANQPLPAPEHHFKRSFGSFVNAEGMAIDHATGSTYVMDNVESAGTAGAYVQKFNSAGAVDKSYGANGSINGTGSPKGVFLEYGNPAPLGLGSPIGFPTGIAVDNDPASPSYRDLFVPDVFNGVVSKWGPNGNYISQIIPPAPFPVAVAVNPANGNVYVAGLFGTVFV
jgi:hypothetical protein